MAVQARLVVGLSLVFAGCALRGLPPATVPAVPVPGLPAPDTPRSLPIDTEEDLWPDSTVRTNVRISNLQFLIDGFERRHGRLPRSFEEFVPAGEGPVILRHDAWGNAIRYTPRGDDYEVRAPGRDGALGTSDDIVAHRGTELPVRVALRLGRTQTIIESLCLRLWAYRHRHGTFPETLDRLTAAGISPILGTKDEWGHPLVYRRTAAGFELSALGIDAEPGTTDDVLVEADSPLCAVPSPSAPPP